MVRPLMSGLPEVTSKPAGAALNLSTLRKQSVSNILQRNYSPLDKNR